MIGLKLQYFGHFMWRVDLLEKTLMLGGIGGRRRRGWPRMRWLDGIMDSVDVGLSELQEMAMDREAWCAVIHGVAKCQTRLSDWTELNFLQCGFVLVTVGLLLFFLPSALCWRACLSSLMGGTGGGKNWVLLWWARPCSVINSSNLIQLSTHGWSCTPSLVVFWPEATQSFGWVNGNLQES